MDIEQIISELQERNEKKFQRMFVGRNVRPESIERFINQLTTDTFNAGAMAVIGEILDIKGVGDMPSHEVSYSQDSSKAYRSGRQDAVADYRARIKDHLTNLEVKIKRITNTIKELQHEGGH